MAEGQDQHSAARRSIHDLENRVRQAETKIAEVAKDISVVSGEMWRIAERIPEDLPTKLVTIEIDLRNLLDTLGRNYVSRDDFIELRTEHRTVKRLVYGFVGVVLMAVAVALVALVVKR